MLLWIVWGGFKIYLQWVCIVPMMSEILVNIKSSGNNSALDQKYVHKTIQTERSQIQQGPNQNFLMYVLLDSSLIINVQTYQQVFVGRCCINEWICSSKEICSEIMWYCRSTLGFIATVQQFVGYLKQKYSIIIDSGGIRESLLLMTDYWWQWLDDEIKAISWLVVGG